MNHLFISLGSNTPDRLQQLQAAKAGIEKFLGTVVWSNIYTCADYVDAQRPPYANCEGEIDTTLEYDQVHSHFKTMEIQAGRTAERRLRHIVPIDIDIICWNNRVLKPLDLQRINQQSSGAHR